MLRWLQQRLGVKYPYPKYYQFAAQGIGGAMENISLVSWDDRFVLDAQTSEEWQHLIDQINVHEMAHMWFGDLVVCRDYTHSWLKESWATYIEQVWYRETRSIDDGDYENFLALSAYRDEADGAYVRPLVMRAFQSSWQMYDRHLYPGGAVRLEMLRGWIGDDAFWRATTRYLKTFSNRVVETDDFRRIVEEESGRSLGRFFDQWIHSPGYPKLKVGFVWDATAQTGTWTIEQTQVDEKRGIGLFEIPTDVGWVIGGQLHTENVLITGARFTHTVRMNERPEQVRVNAFFNCDLAGKAAIVHISRPLPKPDRRAGCGR
jgi:aminopeptidase N